VKASKTIVIIGGGATGVEIAAEYTSAYQDKEVTVVNSNNQLVAPFAERTQLHFQELLTNQHRIKLVLGKTH